MPDPTPPESDPTGTPHQAPEPIYRLCELDGQALDAVLATRTGGADTGPVPADTAQRAQKMRELLGLLDLDAPQDPPADLTGRALEQIRAHQQRQRFTSQVQMLSEPRRTLGVAWHQLLAAAAVFIIGASLLMPVMERQQSDALRVTGAGHLRAAGQAMQLYALANNGQMPRGQVKPGSVWWDVGQPDTVAGQGARSNSAHLYLLVRLGYATPQTLACPENPFANDEHLTTDKHDWLSPQSVSYSYQNQYTLRAIRLEDVPRMAVLADRNPLFIVRGGRVFYDPTAPHDAASRAHRGLGQNILTADGTVSWRLRPTLDPLGAEHADNIWTINGVDFYTGRETPSSPDDSFLVP